MHHPSMFRDKTTPTSVVSFFSMVCPFLLRCAREKRLHGKIGFSIEGQGGGIWKLDLDSYKVTRGSLRHASMVIETDAEQFLELINGGAGGTRAVQSGRLKVRGETALLRDLVQFLNPAQAA